MKDYAQLKKLLEAEEKFPLQFTFKFVGRNSPGFAESVKTLQERFPALRETQTRESSGGKHLSKTFSFEAPRAESIVEIYRAVEGLEDILVVL